MSKFMINNKCKKYRKEDKHMQKMILRSIENLNNLIKKTGETDINNIFNNEKITYDRINNNIFIYKDCLIDRIQLRLVYSYEKSTVYLIDYIIKRTKKSNKKYLLDFNSKYKESKLSDFEFYEMIIR